MVCSDLKQSFFFSCQSDASEREGYLCLSLIIIVRPHLPVIQILFDEIFIGVSLEFICISNYELSAVSVCGIRRRSKVIAFLFIDGSVGVIQFSDHRTELEVSVRLGVCVNGCAVSIDVYRSNVRLVVIRRVIHLTYETANTYFLIRSIGILKHLYSGI